MKMLAGALLVLSAILSKPKDIDLERVRKNFGLAVADKAICETMLVELRKDHPNSLNLAYLGGFQTIWAKHVFNPVTKMETFKKGKGNIDQAVKKDSLNVEIRFIRFSIQTNCPWFLPYHQQEKEDKSFLMANRRQVNSPSLNKLIDDILKDKK